MKLFVNLGSIQELANQTLFFFILDASEEPGSETRDGFRLIERHLVVDFAAREMARLALSLENRLYV